MTINSPNRRKPRKALRAIVATAAAALLAITSANPAGADTSTADASAILLVGAPLLAPATASNDGTQPTVTSTSGSGILPANTVVSAGVAGQVSVARTDGTSAACGGLVSSSSAITIAPNGSCINGTANTGVSVGLTGLIGLTAGAITAECTASSTGAATGDSQLANASINALVPLATLNPDPAVNETVSVAGLATITLNKQVTNPDGSLTITAFSIDLVGIGLVEIGQVTCGPNAVAGEIPLIPMAGLPIAFGVLALSGAALMFSHRRRLSPVH